jgi:hypothetical protein
MKSIGIMTFHGSQNYGGVLQAYALLTYLKNKKENRVKIIDFKVRDVPIFKPVKNWKDLLLLGIVLWNYPSLKRKANRFEQFRNEQMDLTERYQTYEELAENPPEFDIYIAGSDQVFYPSGELADAFYLDFVSSEKSRKVAYAPSFGVNHVPDERKGRITELLNRFDFLSARESGGSKIIRALTGRNVLTVLDPVFLLDRERWRQAERPVQKIARPYILCYALIGRVPQMKIADRVKQLTGLPIVLVTHSLYPRTDADIVIHDAGPREFLWLFDNAEYVVTDSFHGTAFSVLFEKAFFSYIAFQEKAERIRSLLHIIGLGDRIFNKDNEFSKDKLTIDFKCPRERLLKEISLSADYLASALDLGGRRQETKGSRATPGEDAEREGI